MKGFSKIQNEILLDSSLDPIAKVVLAGLDYYDRGRGCFCKRTTLAKLLNVSIYQLRKALRLLEEGGYITIHKRHHGLTDVICRVKPDKPLSGENSNSSYKKHNKKKNTIANNSEEFREKTKDKNDCLTPAAAEPPPVDLKATEACHKRLQTYLTYKKWEDWFSDSYVVDENNQALTICAPKPYVADYINKVYRSKIEAEEGKELILLGVKQAKVGKNKGIA